MQPSILDALVDGATQAPLDPATTHALAVEVAARLGAGFRAIGAFVEHVPSGIELAVVPGGPSVMGALASEQAHFDDASVLDDPRHQAVVESGELELLRRATLASVPALGTRVRPFLLARAPMTRAQAEALGLARRSSAAPRIFGGQAEQAFYFLPGELDASLVPDGLRLPSEHEWEHACRFGGARPFRWGAELPTEPVDPPHPLGLLALGWHRERCAGSFRPSNDPEARPSADGIARGGAAALHPWQLGCAEWTLLLPYRRVRLTSDVIDGQHAVRWALDIPGLEPPGTDPEPLGEEVVPTLPSKRTLALVEALASNDARRWAEALGGATRLAAGGLWSAQCVHLVPALVDALARADDHTLPCASRALAIVAAGDPAAFSATGFDPTRPGWKAACATNAARALRASLATRAASLASLLEHPSPLVRTHAAYLLPLVAPDVEVVSGALSTALASERDELALLSEAIAYGLVARRRGPSASPRFGLGERPLPRAARVLASLPLGHVPSDDELTSLVEAARLVPVDVDRVPWHEGRLDMLVAFHLGEHDPRPLSAARFLARLARAAGTTHALAASYVSGALALGFRGRRLTTAQALTDAERAVLEDLSAFDVESPRVSGTFEALGIPATAPARRRWLAS